MEVKHIHDFWFRDGDPLPRLNAMAGLREYIDQLPKTSQSFRLRSSDHRKTPIDEYHPVMFREEMLVMAGSWRVPEPIGTGKGGPEQWVNPNYTDRHLFPASYAKCDCGTIISRGYNDGSNRFDAEHDHNGCGVPERLRARANMLERRRDILRRGLRLGCSGRQLAAQLGIEAKGLGEIARMVGISIKQEKDRYRRRAGRTYAYMMRLGIDAELVADAYGVHRDSLVRWTRRYTECEYVGKQWQVPTEEVKP